MKFWYRQQFKRLSKYSEFQISYNEWCPLCLVISCPIFNLCVFACMLGTSVSVLSTLLSVTILLFKSLMYWVPRTKQTSYFNFCSSFTVKHVNDYFVFQAAYYMTKPSVLQRHLSDTLKLNEDKCDAFVNVWINSAKGIVEHLRKRSLFPAQVSKMLEVKLF